MKVLNSSNLLVGHLEAPATEFLSPLIDYGLITIEGILPKSPKSGDISQLTCQLHFLMRPDLIKKVSSLVKKHGAFHFWTHDTDSFLFACAQLLILGLKYDMPNRNFYQNNFDKIFASGSANENGRKIAEPDIFGAVPTSEGRVGMVN